MKLLLLDYDNTIARPQSKPSLKTLQTLALLSQKNYVAVITGGRSFTELKKLFVKNLPKGKEAILQNILLCTEYGNLIYSYEKKWSILSKSTPLKEVEAAKIRELIENISWNKYGIQKSYGQRIRKRISYISIDCLGKNAPRNIKERWDSSKKKRESIKEEIQVKIDKKYDIYITGRNTIDIIPKGFNKADCVLRLCRLLSISLKECIFFGDEFNKDGNDYPILALGIQHYKVENPAETLRLLNNI